MGLLCRVRACVLHPPHLVASILARIRTANDGSSSEFCSGSVHVPYVLLCSHRPVFRRLAEYGLLCIHPVFKLACSTAEGQHASQSGFLSRWWISKHRVLTLISPTIAFIESLRMAGFPRL